MRHGLCAMACACGAGLVGLDASVGGAVMPGACTVRLELVAQGLTSPVFATGAGDGSGRLFVVDQVGLIRIIDSGGNLLPTPFLDLTSVMVTVNPGYDERGALGLAFHPDYASNGRFFVRYSAPRTGVSGEPCFGTSRGCHKEVLAEYEVSLGDPNVADPTPVAILLEVDEPEFNHDAGSVEFGPDGYLYMTLGDGGGANDGLDSASLPHGAIGNGQNKNTLLGSLLRLDVDSGAPYAIPITNPFVGVDGADEIFAYGFRNPYRFSFDDAPGGDGTLYVTDVGQNLYEELNIVTNGGNYGWVTREGFHCFDPFNPTTPPAMCSTTGPDGEALLDPVAEYDHTDGIAIVGGWVYRGATIPPLQGKYVCGDFSTGFGAPDGRIFFMDTEGDLSVVFEMQRFNDPNPLGRYVHGFGRDDDGELYLLSSLNLGPTGTAGTVHKLVPPLPDCKGDLDGDGSTGVLDFGLFAPNFGGGAVTPYTGGDLDGDGDVDVFDFGLLAADFGCVP